MRFREIIEYYVAIKLNTYLFNEAYEAINIFTYEQAVP